MSKPDYWWQIGETVVVAAMTGKTVRAYSVGGKQACTAALNAYQRLYKTNGMPYYDHIAMMPISKWEQEKKWLDFELI